jgi:hypothetical protein
MICNGVDVHMVNVVAIVVHFLFPYWVSTKQDIPATIIAIIKYVILVTPILVAVSLLELTVFFTFNLERGNLPMRGVLGIEYDFNIAKFSDKCSGGFGITHHSVSVCFGHLNRVTLPNVI